MNRPLAWAILGALAPLLGAAGADTPIVLRYQFRQGPPAKYHTEVTQHLVVANAKGQLGNLDVTSSYALELAQKVTAIGANHEYELTSTPESVVLKLEGPMAKSAAQISEMLRKVGFVMKVDWQGRVKELTETEGTPDAAKKMTAALKTALGQLLPMLPEGPQAPGSRWRQELPLTVDLPTGDKLLSRLTVDYVWRGYALVDGRTCADLRMTLHLGLAGSMGQGKTKVAITGEGAGQGYAYLDLKEGQLVGTGLSLLTRSNFKSDTVELNQTTDATMRMSLKK